MNHRNARWGVAPLGVVFMGLAVGSLTGCARQEPAAPATTTEVAKPTAPTRDQLLGASVSGVFDAPVTLTAGLYEGPPAAAGAASRPTLKLWDSTIEFVDVHGAPA